MVGFYARADSTKPIRTDLDNELVGMCSSPLQNWPTLNHLVDTDARWYTREEILAVLNHKAGTRFGGRDFKKMAEIVDGANTEQKAPAGDNAAHVLAPPDPRTLNNAPKSIESESKDDPPFRLPPTTAIAGVLIRDWAERRIGFPPEETVQKGNL
jgi:NAD+ diphosphatase